MKRLCLLFVLLVTAASGSRGAAAHPGQITLARDRIFPYTLIGQLLFDSGGEEYVGSGTVIRASSVLTAGHNVYDADTGWSTNMEFRRGNYGTDAIADTFANHLYLLGGYQVQASKYGGDDIRAFAYDTAGLGFPSVLAGGLFLRTSVNPALLTRSYFQFAVGYGAEGAHTGDYPLYVSPSLAYYRTYGSFEENRSLYFEGGMSGGPNLSYVPNVNGFYVSGVIVSGATDPDAGGIHAIDAAVTNFILVYLR